MTSNETENVIILIILFAIFIGIPITILLCCYYKTNKDYDMI
jgi:hypothetical protein